MRYLMRMVVLIMMLGMLIIMIEVLDVVMMRAMLVVMMKVMIIVKIKDKDGEGEFGCGDDVDGCDSNIDDSFYDGGNNINGDDDAKKDYNSKDDIDFKGNNG